MNTREFDLYFARLVRNEYGWRFTICEVYHTTEGPSWCLVYIAWHPHPETRKRTLRLQLCR